MTLQLLAVVKSSNSVTIEAPQAETEVMMTVDEEVEVAVEMITAREALHAVVKAQVPQDQVMALRKNGLDMIPPSQEAVSKVCSQSSKLQGNPANQSQC